MAKTLFIVADSTFTGLPQTVRDRAVAETKTLLAFILLKIDPRPPGSFPAVIDFTDSIVKLVETDADVGTIQNWSNQQQLANIRFSIRQKGVNLVINPAPRSPAVPDRGGVGFHWKEVVTVGSDKVAIAVTGGLAALEFVSTAVLTGFAGGRTRQEILEFRHRAIDKRARQSATPGHDIAGRAAAAARYFAAPQGQVDEAGLATWSLEGKPLTDWPRTHQEAVGIALARVMAHEARHQYLVGHFNGSGLGADEPIVWGHKSFEQFDKADQQQISSAVQVLQTAQNGATIRLETFPTRQPFPF